MSRLIDIIMALVVIGLLALIACQACFAEIDDAMAVRALIGEASNQGYEGMCAHASAFRNRGTLQGIYGLNAPHVSQEPEWVWKMARRAWEASRTMDYVGGADHFGSVLVDKAWIAKMEKTMIFVKQIKDVRFYKEK